MRFERKRILITVKTYPNPSSRHCETVCVAGIIADPPHRWIRIYPVPFRDLPYEQQFKKFDIVSADIAKNARDPRPESYKVDADSIKIVGSLGIQNSHEKRREVFQDIEDPSMCNIFRDNKQSKKSLGIFRPKTIEDFIIEKDDAEWKSWQLDKLSQKRLFGNNRSILEKIPYKFKIKYSCVNNDCSGHNQTIVDWETAQLYRKLKTKYDEETVKNKIIEKYKHQIFIPSNDVYFIVGNQLQHPSSFLILSIFWPPAIRQFSIPFTV